MCYQHTVFGTMSQSRMNTPRHVLIKSGFLPIACNCAIAIPSAATQLNLSIMDARTLPANIRKYNDIIERMNKYPERYASRIKILEGLRDDCIRFLRQKYPDRRYSQRTAAWRTVMFFFVFFFGSFGCPDHTANRNQY